MLKRYLILISFLCLASVTQAHSPTADKQFWVSFFGRVSQAQIDSNMLNLFVLVSSKNGCTGTVENPNTGYIQAFTVNPGSIQKVFLPPAQCYNRSDGDTVLYANTGLLVRTSDTASVYLGNYKAHSFDASGVLPLSSLGYEYKVANYLSSNESCLLVVATEDSTKISFSLSNSIDDENSPQQIYQANQVYEKTLNRGQSFLAAGYGLMNSSVKSTNCKPIAVFAGNYCPYVPTNCGYCDVLVEQMPPLNSWGKSFVTTNTLDRNIDSKLVILSKENDTKVSVSQNGGVQTMLLNVDEYLELNSQRTGIKIEADKAIAVTQYAIGKECSGIGDPMMMWLVPTQQRIKEAIFAAIPSPYIENHYVQVFVRTQFVAQTLLDGVSIAASFIKYQQDANYSVARLQITPSTHVLKNPDGFIAYVYGYDGGMHGTDESYGYCLNFSYQNVEDIFSVSNKEIDGSALYFETNDSSQLYLPSDTITVIRNIESEFISVSWLVNNQPYTVNQDQSQAQFSWSLIAANLSLGENTLSMIIHRSCRNDTLSAKLWLRAASISASRSDTIIRQGETIQIGLVSELNGVVHWIANGQALSQTGTSFSVSPSQTTVYQAYVQYGNYRTDTITITITVLQAKHTLLTDTICANQFYYFDGQAYNRTGVYEQYLRGANGCDSIISLHLQVNPAYDLYETVLVHWDSTYFYNGVELKDGKYTFFYQSEWNCDSTLHLEVKKQVGSNCPDISIPQYFSPNADGFNDIFIIANIACYPKASIEIFDRFGKLLIRYKGDVLGWDGTYLGLPLPTTDYWYVVHLPEIAKRYVGHFLLKR